MGIFRRFFRVFSLDETQAALRKGRADIDIPFAREIKGVFPVWIVGRYLFDLCRLYGKPTIN